MKEYKLFNTDGKTFFDFRSNLKSRCEGFTITYCDDGTVVMSGDYGCLCWKRRFHHVGEEDFYPDYGFPGKNENEETNMRYFEEKVCQFRVPQKIREFNKDKAIEDFKERYKEYEGKKLNGDNTYEEIIEELNWIEDYDEIKFRDIVGNFDCDAWEYEWDYYTEQFKFMFKVLKSVSNKIWEAIKKKEAEESGGEQE